MLEIWHGNVIGLGILLTGLCVGSFLNVVIYRLPRGLSVNEPKRSFCPHCKTTLPWWQNLPIITWALQRGKCRSCRAPIPVRYLLVEVVTGALFFGAWWYLPMISAILAIALFVILVTITFIDAEHQIIPIRWTTAGVVIAFAGSFLLPLLLDLTRDSLHRGFFGPDPARWMGLKEAFLGWLVGFGTLWLVVHLGKLAFGRQNLKFEEPSRWKLQEGHGDDPQLHWIVGEEAWSWDDLFFRASDQLIIEGHGIKVDGKRVPAKGLKIFRDHFEIGDQRWEIENLKSLEGKLTKAIVPREAMGMGDPHLLGMIGAFLGWKAVIFVTFSSSIYGIILGVAARVGFGRPLPFGPFLALGAVTWIFGGWWLWERYFSLLGH